MDTNNENQPSQPSPSESNNPTKDTLDEISASAPLQGQQIAELTTPVKPGGN